MAKLTTKERKKIPTKEFALSGRREPINDKSHAKAALTMGMRDKSPAEKAKIRTAVHHKFPDVGKKDNMKKPASKAKHEGGKRPREHENTRHEGHDAIGSHEGRMLSRDGEKKREAKKRD